MLTNKSTYMNVYELNFLCVYEALHLPGQIPITITNLLLY